MPNCLTKRPGQISPADCVVLGALNYLALQALGALENSAFPILLLHSVCSVTTGQDKVKATKPPVFESPTLPLWIDPRPGRLKRDVWPRNSSVKGVCVCTLGKTRRWLKPLSSNSFNCHQATRGLKDIACIPTPTWLADPSGSSHVACPSILSGSGKDSFGSLETGLTGLPYLHH